MVHKIFDKKSSGIINKVLLHQQLDENLHKPIIGKFEKRKVYPSIF